MGRLLRFWAFFDRDVPKNGTSPTLAELLGLLAALAPMPPTLHLHLINIGFVRQEPEAAVKLIGGDPRRT